MAETSAAGALYGVVRSTLVATFMSWNLATAIDQGSSTPNRSMETRRSSLSTMRELKARRSATVIATSALRWKFTERVYEIRYVDATSLAGSAPRAAAD